MLRSVEDTASLATELSQTLTAADIVLLSGDLGVGKTTFVRCFLRAIGYDGPVRSPTFNLMQTYATEPPVLHADLYRLQSAEGVGLEEYFETHLCLIEWPDRLGHLVEAADCWRIDFKFDGDDRIVEISRPQ